MKGFNKRWFWGIIGWGFIPAILLLNNEVEADAWLITFLIVAIVSAYTAHLSVEREYIQSISDIKKKAQEEVSETERLRVRADKEQALWKQTMLERNAGFKTLLSFISYFERLRDEPISSYLSRKSHPAFKAADVVKEQTKLRREADLQNKRTQALIEMYEQYAPFLIELKDDIPDVNDVTIFEEYSEEE